jgi:hypothetical protein
MPRQKTNNRYTPRNPTDILSKVAKMISNNQYGSISEIGLSECEQRNLQDYIINNVNSCNLNGKVITWRSSNTDLAAIIKKADEHIIMQTRGKMVGSNLPLLLIYRDDI